MSSSSYRRSSRRLQRRSPTPPPDDRIDEKLDVSPGSYPPIEFPDFDSHVKKYPEMVKLLTLTRGISQESLEQRPRSSTTTTAELLLEQNNGTSSSGEDAQDVKNYDVSKLQWELESLLVEAGKRKEILLGFINEKSTPPIIKEEPIAATSQQIKQEKIIINNDVTTASATAGGSGLLLGRGCREKKVSLRKLEQIGVAKPPPTNNNNTRASISIKKADKKVIIKEEVCRKEEVFKVEVKEEEVEDEPDPEEVQKAETRKEFHEFVDSFIGKVTPTEVEYINHLWHLGEYAHTKNDVTRSIIQTLYASTVGYTPNPAQQEEQVAKENGKLIRKQNKQKYSGPVQGSSSTTKHQKQPTNDADDDGGDGTRVVYTALRRDKKYIRQLEYEIQTILKLETSMRIVLVNPENCWKVPIRGLVPPFKISPLLNPRPTPPGLKDEGGGHKEKEEDNAVVSCTSARTLSKAAAYKEWLDSRPEAERKEIESRNALKDSLAMQLECLRFVNAVNLLELKSRAEISREYSDLKSRLDSLDNCVVEVQFSIERVKKRIKDFGDEDGMEGENLKKLKQAAKNWLQSRGQLCLEMDILERKLFPVAESDDCIF